MIGLWWLLCHRASIIWLPPQSPPSHDYHRTSMTEVNRANRTLQWKVDESSMNNWDLNFKNGNRLAKSIQSTRMGSSDAHNYLHWCWLCGSDDVGCVAPWCYVNLLCGSTMWIDWCWLCDSSDSSDWCRCTILMSRMLDAADDLVAIMSTISFEKAHSNECIQRTLPIQQAQSNKPSPTQPNKLRPTLTSCIQQTQPTSDSSWPTIVTIHPQSSLGDYMRLSWWEAEIWCLVIWLLKQDYKSLIGERLL